MNSLQHISELVTNLNTFDGILILSVLVLSLFGFYKGAVRQVLPILAILFSLSAGYILSPHVAQHESLASLSEMAPNFIQPACFVGIFIASFIVSKVLFNWVFKRPEGGTPGLIDSSLGAGLGSIKAVVLLVGLCLAFQHFTWFHQFDLFKNSQLRPELTRIGNWVMDNAPEAKTEAIDPIVKEWEALKLKDKVQHLKDSWLLSLLDLDPSSESKKPALPPSSLENPAPDSSPGKDSFPHSPPASSATPKVEPKSPVEVKESKPKKIIFYEA